MQSDKAEQVIFHALACVFRAGPGPENERPVTGLSEQEFPGSLVQFFMTRSKLEKSVQPRHRMWLHPMAVLDLCPCVWTMTAISAAMMTTGQFIAPFAVILLVGLSVLFIVITYMRFNKREL